MSQLLKEEYVKTALYAYPKLLETINRYQNLVYTRAINSSRACDHAFEQCAAIAELQYQIQTLKELEVTMTRSLKRLNAVDRCRIGYYYFKTVDIEELIRVTGSSKIQTHAKNHIISCVTRELAIRGINNDWFEKEGLRVPMLKKQYEETLLKDKKNKTQAKNFSKAASE